jgi:hypothetical protein
MALVGVGHVGIDSREFNHSVLGQRVEGVVSTISGSGSHNREFSNFFAGAGDNHVTNDAPLGAVGDLPPFSILSDTPWQCVLTTRVGCTIHLHWKRAADAGTSLTPQSSQLSPIEFTSAGFSSFSHTCSSMSTEKLRTLPSTRAPVMTPECGVLAR